MDMSDSSNYQLSTHITGFDSEAYNGKIEAIYKEKKVESRSAMLHEAEGILMDEMPVVPIVFHKNAYLVNDKLETNNTKFFFWKKSTLSNTSRSMITKITVLPA